MKDAISHRIDILYSFPSNYSSSVFNLRKRKRLLKILGLANLIILFLAIGLSVIAFFTMHTSLDFYITWNKLGLFAIISIPFFLRAKNDFTESKIINHIEYLSNLNVNVNLDAENRELINISKEIKKSAKSKVFIGLGFVVVGSGIVHVLALDNVSDFWPYIIYVYFAFIFYAFYIYRLDKQMLDDNFQRTLEKSNPLKESKWQNIQLE